MQVPVEAPEPRSRGIRWWPACLIVFFAAAAVYWYQYFDDLDQQHRNIQTAEVAVAATGLLLIWVVLFSRLKWGTRLIWLGGVFVLLGLATATLRIRGVTGDLVPVLEWRWATAELPPLPLAGSTSRRRSATTAGATDQDRSSSAGDPRGAELPPDLRARSQRSTAGTAAGSRLGNPTARRIVATGDRGGVVRICHRGSLGNHDGTAGRARAGDLLRPANGRTHLGARRRRPLRNDDRRGRATECADDRRRASIHRRRDGDSQLPGSLRRIGALGNEHHDRERRPTAGMGRERFTSGGW